MQIGIKMDSDRRQLTCIPIKFQSLIQFCDVDLTNLTRESFLNDSMASIEKFDWLINLGLFY